MFDIPEATIMNDDMVCYGISLSSHSQYITKNTYKK